MTIDDLFNAMDRWIKKYLFIALLSGLYFWISVRIHYSLLFPDPVKNEQEWNCGTGLFAIYTLHFVLAVLTSLILTAHFMRKRNYPLWFKISLVVLVLVLPILTYNFI